MPRPAPRPTSRASFLAAAVAAAAFSALVLGAAPPAAALTLDKGPYLQHVTRTSAVVVWETQDAASAHVRWGTTPDLPERSAPTSPGRHHEVVLAGLAPDTAYWYALYDGDTPVSATAALRTAPPPDRPFRFVVYGDNRSDHLAHAEVVAGILAEPDVAFAVNTGDLVSDGEVEAQWTEFFAIEAELAARVPIWPTIGNHEEDGGEVPIYDRLFVLPADAGTEHYYTFTWGNSRFIVLDGHVEVEPWYLCLLQLKPYDGCFTRDQDAFLRRELEAAAIDASVEHVFVITHVGPYSSKEGRSGSPQMRAWLDTFRELGVDVVFSGHDHYYEHGHAANGLDYVMTGGGGAPLYEVNPGMVNWLLPHTPIHAESVHHYVVVDVARDWVQVTARLPDGTLVEQFEVGIRPPCLIAADCAGNTPGACAGTWTCDPDNTCRWVCDPPPACVTVADCPAPPDGLCPGHWECALGTCAWRCTGGECAGDGDCAALEPLNDCWGGAFRCVDEVCEWTCPPPPPDAGGPPPDVADAGSTAPDLTEPPAPDAAPAPDTPGPAPDLPAGPDDGPPGADAPPLPADDTAAGPPPGQDAAAGSGEPPAAGAGTGSSGCAAGATAPPAGAGALLLLVLALVGGLSAVGWRRGSGRGPARRG